MLKRQSHLSSEEENGKHFERQRLRHKIMYQWGIPITVGVFSFLYWFLLIPLVYPLLHTKSWAIIGPIAFFMWLMIIFPFLWLWRYKQKSLIAIPPPLRDNSEYPLFPTKAAPVQPLMQAKHSPCSRSQDSSMWIPIQPGNVTPSLYNSQTGRESFQSDYRLDDIPKKTNEDDVDLSRNNSGIQLVKKLDSENQSSSSHRLISVSSSSTDSTGLDFKKIQRDPGDGLDAKENNKDMLNKQYDLDSLNDKTEAVIESEKPCLERDQSFQGLPDMQNFGEYLHLVTVDTPMSPRDVFFSDLAQQELKTDSINTEARQRRSYHPREDLSEVQRRIAEARKSLPPLFHYPSLELGEPRVLKTTTLPAQTVLKIENENVHRPTYFRSISEGEKRSWGTIVPRPKTSGEFFIAHVTRLESITSEVQMNVQPSSPQTCLISRWDTKKSSIAASPSSMENSSKTDETIQGRWVILSKDYASNYAEAFIRVEQEAMVRERTPGRLVSEETDNDSVFLELDQ